MREAFGGTGLFMIVIFFVILFVGYLCLSINQTRAFNVKNTVVRITERHGVAKKSIDELANEAGFRDDLKKDLEDAGYRTVGSCDGGSNVRGFNAVGERDDSNPVVCIEYVSAGGASTNPNATLHYFKVTTFYHFDLPIIRSVFKLTIKGDTKAMR